MWGNLEDPGLSNAASDPLLLVREPDSHLQPSVQHTTVPEKFCLFQNQHCIPTGSGRKNRKLLSTVE